MRLYGKVSSLRTDGRQLYYKFWFMGPKLHCFCQFAILLILPPPLTLHKAIQWLTLLKQKVERR